MAGDVDFQQVSLGYGVGDLKGNCEALDPSHLALCFLACGINGFDLSHALAMISYPCQNKSNGPSGLELESPKP